MRYAVVEKIQSIMGVYRRDSCRLVIFSAVSNLKNLMCPTKFQLVFPVGILQPDFYAKIPNIELCQVNHFNF